MLYLGTGKSQFLFLLILLSHLSSHFNSFCKCLALLFICLCLYLCLYLYGYFYAFDLCLFLWILFLSLIFFHAEPLHVVGRWNTQRTPSHSKCWRNNPKLLSFFFFFSFRKWIFHTIESQKCKIYQHTAHSPNSCWIVSFGESWVGEKLLFFFAVSSHKNLFSLYFPLHVGFVLRTEIKF